MTKMLMVGPCCGVEQTKEKTGEGTVNPGVRERWRAVCTRVDCDWKGKPKRKRKAAVRDAQKHTHK